MLESENTLSSNKLEPVAETVKGEVVIDIGPPPPLEPSLRKKLEQTLKWEAFDETFTLSRIPRIMLKRHKGLYEPRVVSIGPYHRGKSCLRAMEAHKPRCLIDFLDRNPAVGLEVYVKRIGELEERARRCYSEDINLSKDEFVEMLLLDGCFILEFYFKVRAREQHILFDIGWGEKNINADLLLFENQIPFFIVETLHSIVDSGTGKGNTEPLLSLLHPCSISPDLEAKRPIYHLLHLYYQWFIPGQIARSKRRSSSTSNAASLSPNSSVSSESPRPRKIISWPGSNKKPCAAMRSIPCATELHEAGVTFRLKENFSDRFDITFKNGVMEIPPLLIDSIRKVFYLNLAAFERSCGAMECDLMSYIALMDSLINTKNDVVLLQRCGIISNMLLHEEELAVFFNQLGEWSMLDSDKHYFASLFSDVQRYYNSRWPRYRAKLMHDYFNNPWSALSVIAAVFLLVLSTLQAIYGMYPYVHH